MDHGAGEGPMEGLEDMNLAVKEISEGGANVIIGHMGMGIQAAKYKKPETAFIYHLSVSTRINPIDTDDKVIVNSVERALSLGADGISVHVNIGSKTESKQLQDLGRIAGQCHKFGLPLLAMMYPRGPGLTDDPKSVEMVSLAARVGAELGADIIKTYYTGNPDSFSKVCRSCPVPVVIAGGAKEGDKALFQIIRDSIDAGGSGVSIGRKAFQHEKRVQAVNVMAKLVHENISVDEALTLIQ